MGLTPGWEGARKGGPDHPGRRSGATGTRRSLTCCPPQDLRACWSHGSGMLELCWPLLLEPFLRPPSLERMRRGHLRLSPVPRCPVWLLPGCDAIEE